MDSRDFFVEYCFFFHTRSHLKTSLLALIGTGRYLGGLACVVGSLAQGDICDYVLLQPYLPQPDASQAGSSPYLEGGALYALGLIYAVRGKEVLGMLRTTLRDTAGEVVQHGAALRVGGEFSCSM